ncbi:hypothetical protein ACHWQZ_G006867 [Mnemiopsis leidyi]
MLDEEMDAFLKSLEEEEEGSTKSQKQPPKRKTKPVNDPLADDLDSILNDPDFETDRRKSEKPTKLQRNPPKKCSVVYIGKKESPISQVSCPNIRCMKCDCGVVCFNDFDWDGNIEYLFLRNNYPDFERLKSRLKPVKGVFAYACQCNSVSVNKQTSVNSVKNSLKWFCGSH